MTASLSRRAVLTAAALIASLAVAAAGVASSAVSSDDLVQSQGKSAVKQGASWH